jgi:hypothetical protein
MDMRGRHTKKKYVSAWWRLPLWLIIQFSSNISVSEFILICTAGFILRYRKDVHGRAVVSNQWWSSGAGPFSCQLQSIARYVSQLSIAITNTWDDHLVKRKGLFWLSFRGSGPWLVCPVSLAFGKAVDRSKTAHLLARKWERERGRSWSPTIPSRAHSERPNSPTTSYLLIMPPREDSHMDIGGHLGSKQ